jgi:DNA-directed RNA polymerase specialized sigma24 family protein
MRQLTAALSHLPDDQRLVLEMKHLLGFSIGDICEQTGHSKPVVVGLLFRAMKRLRVLMDGRDSEAGNGCPKPTSERSAEIGRGDQRE